MDPRSISEQHPHTPLENADYLAEVLCCFVCVFNAAKTLVEPLLLARGAHQRKAERSARTKETEMPSWGRARKGHRLVPS